MIGILLEALAGGPSSSHALNHPKLFVFLFWVKNIESKVNSHIKSKENLKDIDVKKVFQEKLSQSLNDSSDFELMLEAFIAILGNKSFAQDIVKVVAKEHQEIQEKGIKEFCAKATLEALLLAQAEGINREQKEADFWYDVKDFSLKTHYVFISEFLETKLRVSEQEIAKILNECDTKKLFFITENLQNIESLDALKSLASNSPETYLSNFYKHEKNTTTDNTLWQKIYLEWFTHKLKQYS